jgi:hypothetical protein
MKTVKKNEDVLRVSDKAAKEMVKDGGWSYCPKSEWRKVRDSRNVGPAGKKGPKGKKGLSVKKRKRRTKSKE